MAGNPTFMFFPSDSGTLTCSDSDLVENTTELRYFFRNKKMPISAALALFCFKDQASAPGIFLDIYLFINLSLYLSIYLSWGECTCTIFTAYTYLSIYLSITASTWILLNQKDPTGMIQQKVLTASHPTLYFCYKSKPLFNT